MSVGRHSAVAAVGLIAAAIAGGGTSLSQLALTLESPRQYGQPHGHASSTGSTSNRLPRSKKKRRNALAARSRRGNRR